MTTPSELIGTITKYQYNPAGIQQTIINLLSELTNGNITIVDPSSPFVFALEASACCTAAAMEQNKANTRKLYPIAAQNEEDLYIHMSDKDFANRFAVPVKTKFTFMFQESELLNKLVLDSSTGIKKIVIPRNTFITVSDTVFSLQYPIEIRQMAHGGLQVVYDTSITSPLQNIETNVIDIQYRQDSNGSWVTFTVDAYQFDIIGQMGSLNAATDFKASITVADQYYYTRVYVTDSNNNWVEIKTTHTDQVYDVTVPTAVLKVVNKTVTVTIPQIYTSTQMLNSKIRIDVYETKGPVNMILWEYSFDSYVTTWKNYDTSENTTFTAPLSTFKTTLVYSTEAVSGGSNGLSFSELKTRVIENSLGEQLLPITNVQAKNAFMRDGYTIIGDIDNITNRVFLALKEVPQSTDEVLIPSASGCIGTITTKLSELVSNNNVIDNDTSITITPKALYKNYNGSFSLVKNEEVNALLALSTSDRAIAVTGGKYLYSPFHYVIDTAQNQLDVRPYYLDEPLIETKTFVLENDTTLLQVSTDVFGVLRTNTGYKIQIVTKSSDAFKALSDNAVFVQLAYTPKGEKDKAYLNGVLEGLDTDTGERIYNFDLSTNFYIDSDGFIQLTKFLLYTSEPRLTKAALLTEFDVIYSTTALLPETWKANDVDGVLGRFLLPNAAAGVSHEKLSVRFGHALSTLWAQARTTITTETYERWTVDVPAVYQENVYARDVDGSMVTIDGSGNPVITKLHSKGDPVLVNGVATYKNRIGDIKLDINNRPILLNPRSVQQIFDVFLVDGVYWFATDTETLTYKDTLATTLVSWLTQDLENISNQLLEKTALYFYPRSTVGKIRALIDGNTTATIEAAQSFVVDIFVSKSIYNDTKLKNKLTSSTIQTILTVLKDSVVSLDKLTTSLRASYGNDVIAFNLTGLGGTLALDVITVLDETNRCSVKKKLTVLGDNSLSVENDITCNFQLYSEN